MRPKKLLKQFVSLLNLGDDNPVRIKNSGRKNKDRCIDKKGRI